MRQRHKIPEGEPSADLQFEKEELKFLPLGGALDISLLLTLGLTDKDTVAGLAAS